MARKKLSSAHEKPSSVHYMLMLSCAHEMVSRSHEIASSAHEMVSRALDNFFLAMSFRRLLRASSIVSG